MNKEQIFSDFAVQNLNNYLEMFGILLCNLNSHLPSIDQVGGNWNSIIALIEHREVFYCKVFRKRTTYLSKELYFLMKPHKQRKSSLENESRKILDFLYEYGPANTTTIKNFLFLSNKTFAMNFDVLLDEMLVTAIKKDKDINQNWSSFIWGTYEEWEKTTDYTRAQDDDYMVELLLRSLSRKEIHKLMGF
jgi:hypothetical protein